MIIIGFSDTESDKSINVNPKVNCHMENMNIEMNLCFFWMLWKDVINKEEYTQLDNILAESLGTGIEAEEEEDKMEEKSCEETLKTLL